MAPPLDILARASAALKRGEPMQACGLAEAVPALARIVAAQELGDMPLYVLNASSLPAGEGGDSYLLGFTHPNLSWVYKGSIGERWFGAGACMVINDTGLVSRYWPAGLSAAYLGLGLHEFAHVLTEGWLSTIATEPAPSDAHQLAGLIGAAVADPHRYDDRAAVEADFALHAAPTFLRV